jgi:hypothetical protein
VNQILTDGASKDILRNVADNASLITLHQTAKAEEDEEKKEKSTINSDITDTEFDFDYEAINTPAYRRAFVAARRRTISANQSSKQPPGLDTTNLSERPKLISITSERVDSQSVKAPIDQADYTERDVTESTPEAVRTSTESLEIKAFPSNDTNFTRHGEDPGPAVHLHPHKRSTSDSITITVDDRPSLAIVPQRTFSRAPAAPAPVQAPPQTPYSRQGVRTPTEIMRQREERNRRREQEAREHWEERLRAQERESAEGKQNTTVSASRFLQASNTRHSPKRPLPRTF